ncbi:class I SAM-dependent methyltransferase [Alteraurantiacibacter aquimixticola]|nr:class I SAM-dependent methyltransferase [Alteraurantiacibacter aquimixticola]
MTLHSDISDESRESLAKAYNEIYQDAIDREAGRKFERMSERYKDGMWERILLRLRLFSRPVTGGTFLDYGCKFGHLTPILMERGAKNVISVDVDDEYLSDGAKFIGEKYNSTYFKSDDCYLDIESNSVDFILVNEVISHINPSLVENFYSECSRVLKEGGEIVISDGNNYSHLKTRMDLIDWYSLWDGGHSKEFGESNYEKKRFVTLRRAFKERKLDQEKLEYYAHNTAGLHGDRLIETVRRALDEGVFIERPHRPGIPPIHPNYGVAMERAFYPLQVEMSLRTYGLDTVQLIGAGAPRPIAGEHERGKTKNFVIRGVKLPESIEALQEYAKTDTTKVDE